MAKSIGADFIRFRENFGETWRGLTNSSKFLIIFLLILSLPFLIESAVWVAATSVLIPLCFLFGVIKHKVPILWIVLIFIINLGGLADLGADVWLLFRMIGMYISRTVDEHFENDIEKNLLLSRLIITLATGLPGILIFYFAMGVESKTEFEALRSKGEKSANTVLEAVL